MTTHKAFFITALIISFSTAADSFAADTYECLIEPTQTVEIRSAVSGLLDTVQVHRGDKITKGQIIATLDSAVEQATADVAKYKSQMAGPLKVAEAKLAFATKTFERRRDMQAQNLMSGQDKEDAERDMKAAEAELQLAQENHRLAELEYLEHANVVERRTIRSPLTGVVVDQMLYPGEMIEPGDSKKPIFKLAALDPLRVRVVMPRSSFGTVKRGMLADITPEMPAGTQLKGTVKIVDPIVDAASSTFAVFVEVPNPKLAIAAGLRCKVRYVLDGN